MPCHGSHTSPPFKGDSEWIFEVLSQRWNRRIAEPAKWKTSSRREVKSRFPPHPVLAVALK
jgi:hypothetical protein